jgi:hypothetical protein
MPTHEHLQPSCLNGVCCLCRKALEAYQEALTYAPNNKVALGRSEFCRTRVQNLGL